MKIDNLDEVVEKITQRVTEKLAAMGALPNSLNSGAVHSGSLTSCTENSTGCTNCGKCICKKPGAVNKIIDIGAARIGSNPGINANFDRNIAGIIDHTILKPEAPRDELKKVCEEARTYGFATVCVNSCNIPFVARLLKGSAVKPIAVVGFPLGSATSTSKAFEAKEAISSGAQEIDMVINIGALKSKDYALVFDDIKKVVEASKPYKVKVILETSKLSDDEKVIACVLSKTAGAHFVKTSTGFGGGGATVDDIKLMRRIVGPDMEVKASGGIKTMDDAKAMMQAGANRIGASASVVIVTGGKSKASGY